MRLGWIQDTHTHTNPNRADAGAQDELIDDFDYLTEVLGCETVYHGGDVCHADDNEDAPHVRPSAYERFFELLSRTQSPDALARLVPGNHDVPLSTFLAADERCVLRDRMDYPNANVSVICLNTQATGFVTGSPGRNGTQGGIGTDVCRVAHTDVRWLREQLMDADSMGHTKLVIPHAALHPLTKCPYDRVHGYNGSIDSDSVYNIVLNFQDVHDELAQYSDVVCPISHLYQFEGEGAQTIDGVEYVFKKHYWKASNDSFETFAFIDINGTGATVTTVKHSDRTATTVLDVTF